MYSIKDLKAQKNTEELEIMYLKCNLYLYFLIKQHFFISGKKILMSAELKGERVGVSRDSRIFGSSLGKV